MNRLKHSPGTTSCFGLRYVLKSFEFKEFLVKNRKFEEMILKHIEKNTRILWTKIIQVFCSMPWSGVLNVAKWMMVVIPIVFTHFKTKFWICVLFDNKSTTVCWWRKMLSPTPTFWQHCHLLDSHFRIGVWESDGWKVHIRQHTNRCSFVHKNLNSIKTRPTINRFQLFRQGCTCESDYCRFALSTL